MFAQNEPVYCRDGFRMSVQASGFHYCTPRVDNADAYTACEVGFPSQAEPMLMEWIEVPGGDPTRSVYVAVPSHVIAEVIAKHGGNALAAWRKDLDKDI